MDHAIRYHDDPNVKMVVVLGEVGTRHRVTITLCTIHSDICTTGIELSVEYYENVVSIDLHVRVTRFGMPAYTYTYLSVLVMPLTCRL